MGEADGKMTFTPNKIEVKKGEQIKFMLRNNGELDHEFILATTAENLKHAESMKKNPDMEHDDPNGKRLAPEEEPTRSSGSSPKAGRVRILMSDPRPSRGGHDRHRHRQVNDGGSIMKELSR